MNYIVFREDTREVLHTCETEVEAEAETARQSIILKDVPVSWVCFELEIEMETDWLN